MVTERTLIALAVVLFVALAYVEPYLLINLKTEGMGGLYLFFMALKYLLIGCFALSLLSLKKPGSCAAVKVLAALVLVTACYAVAGVAAGNSTTHLVYSLKYVYSWVFLLLLFSLSPLTSEAAIVTAFKVSVVAALANLLYSLCFDLFLFHDLKDLYFYRLYSQLGMFSEWNVVRDGKLRYAGFLGSNLAMSQILLLPISYLASLFFLGKRGGARFFCAILLALLLFFLYKTSARNPVMALSFSLAFLWLSLRFSLGVRTRIALFALMYLLSFFVVVLLNAMDLGDPSSLQRMLFLLRFWEGFSANPLGYGLGSAGISIPGYRFFYESALTTLLTDAGVFGVLFLLPVLVVLFRSSGEVQEGPGSGRGESRVVAAAVAILAAALLFMTNFSNIFDNSLYLFSLVLGCYWKTAAGRGRTAHA